MTRLGLGTSTVRRALLNASPAESHKTFHLRLSPLPQPCTLLHRKAAAGGAPQQARGAARLRDQRRHRVVAEVKPLHDAGSQRKHVLILCLPSHPFR